jgi:hypothetical protein
MPDAVHGRKGLSPAFAVLLVTVAKAREQTNDWLPTGLGREKFAANGWSVSVLEKGERFQAWQHVETAKEDGGKVFIEIRDTGAVEIHEGCLARR